VADMGLYKLCDHQGRARRSVRARLARDVFSWPARQSGEVDESPHRNKEAANAALEDLAGGCSRRHVRSSRPALLHRDGAAHDA
jgi:hypothetical protein